MKNVSLVLLVALLQTDSPHSERTMSSLFVRTMWVLLSPPSLQTWPFSFRQAWMHWGRLATVSQSAMHTTTHPPDCRWGGGEGGREREKSHMIVQKLFFFSHCSPFIYSPSYMSVFSFSFMLWQWCSMLMRQYLVQPQAVIFQVIS